MRRESRRQISAEKNIKTRSKNLRSPTKTVILAFENKKGIDMEYAVTLQSQEDYRLLKKLLKAFDGASIRPLKKSHIEQALEEARTGKIVGPFHTTKELTEDLLN